MSIIDQTNTNTSAPERPDGIPVRRVSFKDPLDGLTRHFARNRNIVSSHITVHLSSVFPAGEDFFVRSVRAYRDQITDPELKERVKGFIGQEAIHGREHRALNERLGELGYNTALTDRNTERLFALRSRVGPKIFNLGMTAALEHFTAVFGEILLTTDLPDTLGHDGMKSILLWHALEECEHKAVAFDVYRHVGGSERMRRTAMNVITVAFIGRIAQLTLFSLLGDRSAWNLRRLRRDLKETLASPLFDRKVWTVLRDYNRDGFHPNDHDTDALVEHWREELFGPNGSLTEYLANPGGHR